jgi:hypothetical protein
VAPRSFSAVMQRLAPSRSRRTLVEGSLAASVLAALGLNQDVFATKHGVATDACIPTGRKCPARRPRGKKGRKLRCRQCCQGYSIRGRRGTRKCSCKPGGQPCTPFSASDCCTGTCQGGLCASVSVGPQCAADGVDCASDAECCSGVCNVGGSNVSGTADECAQCRTGRARCAGDPSSCCGARTCTASDRGGANPNTRCCSLLNERCSNNPGTTGACCTTGEGSAANATCAADDAPGHNTCCVTSGVDPAAPATSCAAAPDLTPNPACCSGTCTGGVCT